MARVRAKLKKFLGSVKHTAQAALLALAFAAAAHGQEAAGPLESTPAPAPEATNDLAPADSAPDVIKISSYDGLPISLVPSSAQSIETSAEPLAANTLEEPVAPVAEKPRMRTIVWEDGYVSEVPDEPVTDYVDNVAINVAMRSAPPPVAKAPAAKSKPAVRKAVGRTKFGAPLAGQDPFEIVQPLQTSAVTDEMKIRKVHYVSGRRNAAHKGTDYKAIVGTPVYGQGKGEVVYNGEQGSYGNMQIIFYGNGIYGVTGHLSVFNKSVDSEVDVTTVVAYTGATGGVTGPHLHSEIWVTDAKGDIYVIDPEDAYGVDLNNLAERQRLINQSSRILKTNNIAYVGNADVALGAILLNWHAEKFAEEQAEIRAAEKAAAEEKAAQEKMAAIEAQEALVIQRLQTEQENKEPQKPQEPIDLRDFVIAPGNRERWTWEATPHHGKMRVMADLDPKRLRPVFEDTMTPVPATVQKPVIEIVNPHAGAPTIIVHQVAVPDNMLELTKRVEDSPLFAGMNKAASKPITQEEPRAKIIQMAHPQQNATASEKPQGLAAMSLTTSYKKTMSEPKRTQTQATPRVWVLKAA